jgi:glycosyltransferase involved in cell wall biosynthesis
MPLSLLSLCLERNCPMTVVAGDDWLSYGPRVDAWMSAWARRPDSVRRLAAQVSGVPTVPPALPAEVPVAFVSEFLRRQAAVSAGAISFSSSEIVPPGIDREDFPAQPPAERPWRDRLLCVGRIEPRKGFDIAVRALAQLPEATLRLIGPSTDHLDDLRSLARDLGVDDRLVADVVPRAELAAEYRDADALLFTSRWDEPFGLVPLEAMTQATPVIATRRGGSAEFLADEENCLAVGLDDPAAVAAAVARLAAEPALRLRLAAGGVKTAARYDVDDYASRLEALHLGAVGARA